MQPALTLPIGTARHQVRPIAAAVATGLAGGIATAYAQRWLPASVGPAANSAGPWLILTALTTIATPRRLTALVVATVTLWMLEIGYVIGSQMQGHPSAITTVGFWLIAGFAVGPVVGAAAHTVRRGSQTSSGVAAGVLCGLLVGEGVHGLTAIAETTPPLYWCVEIAIAVTGLAFMVATRLHRPRAIAIAVAAVGASAGAVVLLYSLGAISGTI